MIAECPLCGKDTLERHCDTSPNCDLLACRECGKFGELERPERWAKSIKAEK